MWKESRLQTFFILSSWPKLYQTIFNRGDKSQERGYPAMKRFSNQKLLLLKPLPLSNFEAFGSTQPLKLLQESCSWILSTKNSQWKDPNSGPQILVVSSSMKLHHWRTSRWIIVIMTVSNWFSTLADDIHVDLAALSVFFYITIHHWKALHR